MSTMTIANHTQIPINAATEWGHIVQEFKNEIDPGQTIELPAASFFGWQDLVVLMSTPKTAISHKQDWASVLGLVTFGVSGLATIGGIALTVVTFGGASPVLVAAGIATSAAGATVLATDAALMGAEFAIRPATLQALWGPDGYKIDVYGGKIEGTFDEKKNEFKVDHITPLRIEWRNKVSGTHGSVGGNSR